MSVPVLWVSERKVPFRSAVTSQLKNLGYEVLHCDRQEKFGDIQREFQVFRFIISSAEESIRTARLIGELNSNLSLRGSRKVLTICQKNDELELQAARSCFRDIIHEDIEPEEFVKRLDFVFAHDGSHLISKLPLSSVKEPLHLHAPGRIIWISQASLKIESNLKLPNNSVASFSSPLLRSFGLDRLKIKIFRSNSTKLNFRFSHAMYAVWQKDLLGESEVAGKMNQLRIPDSEEKPRLYFALKNKKLSEGLISKLSLQFDIAMAPDLASLCHEPPYFNPDLIVIEKSFFTRENKRNLNNLLLTTPKTTSFCVIGQPDDDQNIFKDHPRLQVSIVPNDLEGEVLKVIRALDSSGEGEGSGKKAWYLKDFEFLSGCDLVISGQMDGLNPGNLSLCIQGKIPEYSLVRVSSPTLDKVHGSPVWAKVQSSVPVLGPEESNLLTLRISALTSDQSELIGKILLSGLARQYLKKENIHFEKTRRAIQDKGDEELLSLDWESMADQTIKLVSEVKRLKDIHKSKGLRYFILLLLVFTAVTWLIYTVLPVFSEDYKKSGDSYTESLKRSLGIEPTK